MRLSRKQGLASIFGALALVWSSTSKAEIKLVESNGWTVTTDGRVNSFVSHTWGDDRPKGFESLQWMGFNEAGDSGETDANHKLQRTRVRGGFVPSTLAFNVKRVQMKDWLTVAARVEVGYQITTVLPVQPGETTWLEPRSVYLDLSGVWGSVRAGRDLGLFPRGNLLMNYELGHAYGVGFPCSYDYVFGGSCGHVGFGTLWPDFHAQITYSTPNFGNIFQLSAGIFDPRTVPTATWTRVPLPRVESEAVAKYDFSKGYGFKAWANGAWQKVGLGYDVVDATTGLATGRKDKMFTAYGVGGGLQANVGPVKAGGAGYMGKGMDGFLFLGFNPINYSRDQMPNEDRELRPSRGFLLEASVTIGPAWIMGGFGKALLDRMDTDPPIVPEDPVADAQDPPLLRSQTGISAGIFYRMGSVVLGIDYFHAQYGFDPDYKDDTSDGVANGVYYDSVQNVNFLNGGVTLEW